LNQVESMHLQKETIVRVSNNWKMSCC